MITIRRTLGGGLGMLAAVTVAAAQQPAAAPPPTTPPLTVVAQPVYDMGAAAANALIRQIDGRPPLAPAPEFNARLVRRGSVGTAPVAVPAP